MCNTFKYKGYVGSIHETPSVAVGYFGKLAIERDLVYYQGDTIQELRATFESAVDDYIETKLKLEQQEEDMLK